MTGAGPKAVSPLQDGMTRKADIPLTTLIADICHQCERQKMKSCAKFISLLVIALIGGALLGWWLREQRDIDACLDAGGRWETPGGYCVGAKFLSPEY